MTPIGLLNRIASRLLARIGEGEQIEKIVVSAGGVMMIRVFGAFLALMVQIFLARSMGAFEFGIFGYAWVWVSVAGVVATFGLDASAVRFIPQYASTGQADLLAGVIRRSREIVLVAGVVIGAVGACLVWLLRDSISQHYVMPLIVAMAIVPVFAQLWVSIGLIRGLRLPGLAYAPFYIARNILLILGVGLVILAGVRPTGTTILIVAGAVCVIVLIGQAVALHRRRAAEIHSAKPAFQTRVWLAVALPLLTAQTLNLVLVNTDIIMLAAYTSPDRIAIYNAAVRTAGLMNFLEVAVAALAVPTFAGLYAQRKSAELSHVATRIVQWIFWPSLIIGSVMLLFGGTILSVFGAPFAAGHTVLAVLVVGKMMGAAAGLSSNLLSVTGSERLLVVIAGAIAALNVVLNMILIPVYGPVGAAAATSVSAIVVIVCHVSIIRRRLGFHSFIIPYPDRWWPRVRVRPGSEK